MIRKVAGMFLLAAALCNAQPTSDAEFEAIARRGIDYVYNLEFERAEKEFDSLVHQRPAHPAGHFFRAMVDWWRIMIDIDDTSHDKTFFEELDGVIELCDSLLEKDPNDVTAIFFKGGSIGYQGRLHFHRDDYLGAANAGRKALPLVQEASSLDPHNVDILLGTGIYNYYAAVLPDQYPFAKPLLLFIPPGDRAKGIEQLTTVAEKGMYASVEASYFLLQIFYFYEKDYGRALQIAERLTARFPHNMVFHRYLGRCYVSLGNWGMAQSTFAECVARARSGMRGYTPAVEREAQYYLGLADMLTRQYDSSLSHFYRCDELSRTLDRNEASGFMAMANLKVGMVYDLQGKRDLAVVQYKKVLGLKEYKDSRAQAEQFLHSPFTQ